MKKWQKLFLWFILIFFVLHSIRDIFEFLHIDNIFTIFVKKDHSQISNIVWTIFNPVVFLITEVIFPIFCLKRNSFGNMGKIVLASTFTFILLVIIDRLFL